MKRQDGFSLVEISLVVVAIGFLGLLVANLPSSIASINRSRHASLARDIASKKIEDLRKQTYNNLFTGTNNFTDTDLGTLPQSSATYTVEDCPITVCTSNERAKQVKVTVSWVEGGDPRLIKLVTIISDGGIGQ